MCLGAMLVLGGARSLSVHHAALPFVFAAGLVGVVWLVYCAALLRCVSLLPDGVPIVLELVHAARVRAVSHHRGERVARLHRGRGVDAHRFGAGGAGSLAGAFLLVQSLAGVVGPSLVGVWFDVTGSRRALFVILAGFLMGAIALLASLAPGCGEAEAPAPLLAFDVEGEAA